MRVKYPNEHPSIDKLVQHVEFTLHETFGKKAPVKVFPTIGAKKTTFGDQRKEGEVSITYRGWGTFELPIKITFKPEYKIPPLTVDHELSFDNKGEFKSVMVYFNKNIIDKQIAPKSAIPKATTQIKKVIANKPLL